MAAASGGWQPAEGSLSGLPAAGELVTFRDGSTILGAAKLHAAGQATFTTASLGIGEHSITAVYAGDGNFLASTSPVFTQTVRSTSQTAKIIGSPATQSVSLLATFAVTVQAQDSSGRVTVFSDGATVTLAKVKGPSTLSSPLTGTLSKGTVTFSGLKVSAKGSYTLRITLTDPKLARPLVTTVAVSAS
jgi:hypothetical protein